MSTLTFKNFDGYYWPGGNSEKIDGYLLTLADIFKEGSGWTEVVKNNLLDQDSSGINGNASEVIIEANNKVIIQPSSYIKNAEECAIEIDKQDLLNLINKWQELVAKECKEIIFTRHEDGSVTLSDK